MEPINNWHETQESGSYEQVELGGHICIIKGVRDAKSKSGNSMLTIQFDFANEDKQTGYFQKQFEADRKTNQEAKWRNNGLINQMHHTDVSNGYFKAFINRVLESNPGYQWTWDEQSLVGKKFGGVFGREEYINAKGESKFAVKCMFTKSIHDVLDAEIPADKLLDKKDTKSNSKTSSHNYGYLGINDEDLPF